MEQEQQQISEIQTIVSPQDLLEKAVSIPKPEKKSRGKAKFKFQVETIRTLRVRNFSYAQIYRFLNDNGFKCSYIGLVSFCHKNFNKR